MSQDASGRGEAGETEPGPGDGDEGARLLARLAVFPGLCATCGHLLLVASPRSVFVRCGLAATAPAFPRYPALPVTRCGGYRPPAPAEPRSIIDR